MGDGDDVTMDVVNHENLCHLNITGNDIRHSIIKEWEDVMSTKSQM